MRSINKLTATLLLIATMISTGFAQQGKSASPSQASTSITPQAPPTPVTGSGTADRLTKWLGSNGTSYVSGDSIITESKFGNIGIGTTARGQDKALSSITPS